MRDGTEVAEAITRRVLPAIAEAEHRHGLLTDDHVRAMLILSEEVGEAAAEILAYTRTTGGVEDRIAAVEELAQVAATAILLITNLEVS